MFHGNCLYSCIKSSVNEYFLLLTDIPSMVSINDKIYALTYSKSFTGKLSMTCDASPCVCLNNAFTNLFFGSPLSNCANKRNSFEESDH